ncbi:MAG: AAA family ATPase [Gammaproteobacteria bacterium]|nr:AAA family ATPase [Gammaproteobacteria bacterium]MDP2140436.1 AAA family ATPase [Gammaproteobacteria bacterium]MDP2349475.1 AAA family ATPase [Gammaproteobacteria bacterium]
MYLEYYSLDRPPFRITPDPSLFFTGGANGRGVVLEALLYAVTSGEGILKVVGEVGSGKTMLCRMLEERLPESVEIVYLANPNLSAQDILYAIAFELKIAVDDSTQRLVLMQRLQEYLLKQHAANRTVVVIIEEAQSMPIETLEEVRLFSNLETHQHKLMQIVLFGQPELDKNLENKAIRQLRERITHSFYLRPLTPDETSDYIRFRLQAAGCPCPQVFSDAAEKLIGKASDGLTRRINILADKAMLAAYAESATTVRPRSIDNQLTPTVLPRHVRAAIKDSGYVGRLWSLPRLAAIAAVVVAVVAAGLWWQISQSATAPAFETTLETAVGTTFETVVATTTESPVSAAAISTADMVEALSATQATIQESSAQSIAAQPEIVQEEAAHAITVGSVDESLAAVTTDELADNSTDDASQDASITTDVANESLADELPEATAVVQEAAVAPISETVEVKPAVKAEQPVGAAVLATSDYVTLPTLLANRSAATAKWLSNVQPGSYIVQLVSVGGEEADYVTTILRRLEQSGVIDQTYACLADSQGQLYWKVFYGSFDTVAQARQFIERLPANIRSNTPFVQNIARLECQISQATRQFVQGEVR